MNNVELKAKELNYSMDEVKRELKRIASIKCRLKKQQGKSTYKEELTKALDYENLLKSVRDLINGNTTPKSVPQYEWEDIEKLSYDETLKAIKSIQSKKSLSKWLTSVEGDNDEYRNACRVEQMLREHKETLQPTTHGISKNDIATILEISDTLSKEELVEMLRSLV